MENTSESWILPGTKYFSVVCMTAPYALYFSLKVRLLLPQRIVQVFGIAKGDIRCTTCRNDKIPAIVELFDAFHRSNAPRLF